MNASSSAPTRPYLAAAVGDTAATECLLQHAHVHVSRYFRSWLTGLPGGIPLCDELAVEALVRIARLPLPPRSHVDADVVATWLTVARDLAREVASG